LLLSVCGGALAVLFAFGGYLADVRALLAQELPPSADDFARGVLRHEVECQDDDHALWTYHEQKRDEGKQKLFLVYQTTQGEIDRLVAVDGKPLAAVQIQTEDQRIQRLISHPGEMRQLQRKRRRDGEQAEDLLRMFPDAFRFQYAGREGSLVRLKFAPNPKFRPPDHAAQVFHHMEGTILLDPQQKRLASIDGELTSKVEFFGGLFGYLDKGGSFTVQQQEVSPNYWEVTAMHVHMSGKALLFKTIAVQEDETYSDFQSVPDDTTLAQAAEQLKRDARESPLSQAKN
jgi:hypothetical protein